MALDHFVDLALTVAVEGSHWMLAAVSGASQSYLTSCPPCFTISRPPLCEDCRQMTSEPS